MKIIAVSAFQPEGWDAHTAMILSSLPHTYLTTIHDSLMVVQRSDASTSALHDICDLASPQTDLAVQCIRLHTNANSCSSAAAACAGCTADCIVLHGQHHHTACLLTSH